MKFVGVALMLFLASLTSSLEAQAKEDWTKFRETFIRETTFNLSENSVALLGANSTHSNKTHPPVWFSFKLFKAIFKKSYASEQELSRNKVFINACMRVLRNRVAQRLANTNTNENQDKRCLIRADDDRFFEEKVFNTRISSSTTETTLTTTTATPVTTTTSQEMDFAMELLPDRSLIEEKPIQKAVRLLILELEAIERQDVLVAYLDVLEEDEKGCVEAKAENWPY